VNLAEAPSSLRDLPILVEWNDARAVVAQRTTPGQLTLWNEDKRYRDHHEEIARRKKQQWESESNRHFPSREKAFGRKNDR